MKGKSKRSYFGHLKFTEPTVIPTPDSERRHSQLRSLPGSYKRSSARNEDYGKDNSRDFDSKGWKDSLSYHKKASGLRDSKRIDSDARGTSWRDSGSKDSSLTQRGRFRTFSRETGPPDFLPVDLDPKIKISGRKVSDFIPPKYRESGVSRPVLPSSTGLKDFQAKSTSQNPPTQESSFLSASPKESLGTKSPLLRSRSVSHPSSEDRSSGSHSRQSSVKNLKRRRHGARKSSLKPTLRRGSTKVEEVYRTKTRTFKGMQPSPQRDAIISSVHTDPLFLHAKTRPDLDFFYSSFPWLETDDPIQTKWQTDHITVPWRQGKPFCCVRPCPAPCFVGPPLLANGGRRNVGLKWLRRRLLEKPPSYDVCGCASVDACPHWCCERKHGPRLWRTMQPVTTWHLAGQKELRPPQPLPPQPLAALPPVGGGAVCNVSEPPPPPPGPQLPEAFACRRRQERKPRKSPPSPALDPSLKGTLWAPTLAALKVEPEVAHQAAQPWQRAPYINVVGAVADAGWQGHDEDVAAREAVHSILRKVVIEGDDKAPQHMPCGPCRRARAEPRNSKETWRAILRRHAPNYCCGVSDEPFPGMAGAAASAGASPEDSPNESKAKGTKEDSEWIRNDILGSVFSKTQ